MPENGEPSPYYSRGAIGTLISNAKNCDGVNQSMKTGKGMNYDDKGGMELANGHKNFFTVFFFLNFFFFLIFSFSFSFFLGVEDFLLYMNTVTVPKIITKLGWDKQLEEGF